MNESSKMSLNTKLSGLWRELTENNFLFYLQCIATSVIGVIMPLIIFDLFSNGELGFLGIFATYLLLLIAFTLFVFPTDISYNRILEKKQKIKFIWKMPAFYIAFGFIFTVIICLFNEIDGLIILSFAIYSLAFLTSFLIYTFILHSLLKFNKKLSQESE